MAAGIWRWVSIWWRVSFVQSPQDMIDAREVATSCGAPYLPLIAKIEKPQAIDCIDGILEVANALMVARGDLGVEIPLEQVPGRAAADHSGGTPSGCAGDPRHASTSSRCAPTRVPHARK